LEVFGGKSCNFENFLPSQSEVDFCIFVFFHCFSVIYLREMQFGGPVAAQHREFRENKLSQKVVKSM